MSIRYKFALFAPFMLSAPLLLTGCTTSGPSREPPAMPLPPAPQLWETGTLAPMTDAVKALYGEWRSVSGPGVSPKDRLTIWSPMFSFGSGCELTQSQLRDLGDGRPANAQIHPAPVPSASHGSIDPIWLFLPSLLNLDGMATCFGRIAGFNKCNGALSASTAAPAGGATHWSKCSKED